LETWVFAPAEQGERESGRSSVGLRPGRRTHGDGQRTPPDGLVYDRRPAAEQDGPHPHTRWTGPDA